MKCADERRFLAYSASATELAAIGKDGKCDRCGMYAPVGYLVPSEDSYLCPVCFKKLQRSARYKRIDAIKEDDTAKRYETAIKLEETVV